MKLCNFSLLKHLNYFYCYYNLKLTKLLTVFCSFITFNKQAEVHFYKIYLKSTASGFPGGAVVGSLPANAGDTGSSPGLGRSHMPRSN